MSDRKRSLRYTKYMKLPRLFLVIKDVFICVLVAAIFLFALFTVPLPTPLGTQSVGTFLFVSFPTGFAFYQNVSPSHFYSISPLDDFVVDSSGGRSTLATLDQLETGKKDTPAISKPTDVLLGLSSYFQAPTLAYQSKGIYPALYKASFSGKTVTINRTITPNSTVLKLTGLTIKYGQDDFIFDQNGQIYNQKSAQDIDQFNQFYGVQLNKVSATDDLSALPVKKIILANPNLGGLIVVKATEHQTLWINRLNNAIEVVEAVTTQQTSSISASMSISVTDSAKEAIKQ